MGAPAFYVEHGRRAGRVQILILTSNKFRKGSSGRWFYVEGLKRSGPMTSIAKKSSFESSLLVKYARLQTFHVEHLGWGRSRRTQFQQSSGGDRRFHVEHCELQILGAPGNGLQELLRRSTWNNLTAPTRRVLSRSTWNASEAIRRMQVCSTWNT